MPTRPPMRDDLDRLNAALAGRYTIQRELGRGGMATVYLATDLRHRRDVALKVMRPDLAATVGAERFLREIEIAAQLHHPHILPLYDSGETDGFLFYVMPYEEGLSLRDRLEREGELPVGDTVRLLSDVVEALAHAHAHGVVHRDVKPENILLSGRHALVTDFGVAKAVSEAAGDESLTTAGVALGTPVYMAPEQAVADPHVDHRADLYAVGVMAYEMLTGEPPFRGAPQSVLAAHVTDDPAPVTGRRATIPPALADLVMQCLAKKAADRPQSAAALLPVLQGLTTPSGGLTPTSTQPIRAGLVAGKRPWLAVGAVAVVLVAAVAIGRSVFRDATPTGTPRTAIAVLPFQNLSADSSRAYFASGLHDELLTQLAKVAALHVISRTSVLGYADTRKPLTEIAAELGVGSIVEGSVQVEGDRLRVSVQLIDAATDEHLWAERYDRTLDDAFAVQSEVAQRVVAAVGAVLGAGERAALASAPTANAEAYRLYLQCHEYLRRPGYMRENFELAQGLCERAIAHDSTFAMAYARLSEAHGALYWERYDYSPDRLARQESAAATALRLAPDLPEAHAAMGRVFYYGRGEFREALDAFLQALEGLPNDAELWSLVGFVQRRLGNWDEAIAAYDRAIELDPRDPTLYNDLGALDYDVTRQYAKAVEVFDQALQLAPDFHMAAILRAQTFLRWTGTTDTLRAVLERTPPNASLGSLGSWFVQRVFLFLLERRPDSLLAVLPPVRDSLLEGQTFTLPGELLLGWTYRLRRDGDAARTAFAAALRVLDSAVAKQGGDWRLHAARGHALAGLGRRTEALAEAQWLRDSREYREDAFQGTIVAEDRAAILAAAGDVAGAVEELARLLAAPSWISMPLLRHDPRWDPLRTDPRFTQLLSDDATAVP